MAKLELRRCPKAPVTWRPQDCDIHGRVKHGAAPGSVKLTLSLLSQVGEVEAATQARRSGGPLYAVTIEQIIDEE